MFANLFAQLNGTGRMSMAAALGLLAIGTATVAQAQDAAPAAPRPDPVVQEALSANMESVRAQLRPSPDSLRAFNMFIPNDESASDNKLCGFVRWTATGEVRVAPMVMQRRGTRWSAIVGVNERSLGRVGGQCDLASMTPPPLEG